MIIIIILLVLILILIAFITKQPKEAIESFKNQSNNYVLFNNNDKYILIDISQNLEPYKNPLLFETYSEYKIYSKQNSLPVLTPNSNFKLPDWLLTLLQKNNILEEELMENEELMEEEKLIEEEMRIEEDIPENELNKWFTNNKIDLTNNITTLNTNNNTNFNGGKPTPTPNTYSEYGYNFMPPSTWSVPQQRPPVCINNHNKCPVCPIIDKGTPKNALELNQVGSILPKFTYKEDENYFYPGWSSKNTNSNYPTYNSNYSMSQKFEET